MSQLDGFSLHSDTEDELIKISERKELIIIKRAVWEEVTKALHHDFLKFLKVIKKYKLKEIGSQTR